MKLFFSLTEYQKSSAIKYFTEQILRDVVGGSIRLEPTNDADFVLFDTLAEAMSFVETITSEQEKIEYLLSQELICDTIKELATSMSSNSVYMDDDETVIYISSLGEPEKQLSSSSVVDAEFIDDKDV
jgi:hypothetical protein